MLQHVCNQSQEILASFLFQIFHADAMCADRLIIITFNNETMRLFLTLNDFISLLSVRVLRASFKSRAAHRVLPGVLMSVYANSITRDKSSEVTRPVFVKCAKGEIERDLCTLINWFAQR